MFQWRQTRLRLVKPCAYMIWMKGLWIRLHGSLVYLFKRTWPRRSKGELKASSNVLAYTETGASVSTKLPDARMCDLSSDVAVRSPLDHVCAPDTYDQTLRTTRVRKIPYTASSAVADSVIQESTKQYLPNTAASCRWIIQHKPVVL